MSAIDVYTAIHSVPVGQSTMPVAHLAFKAGSAPSLPWCVYYLDKAEGIVADGINYAVKSDWIVEHYWDSYNATIETAIEAAITNAFGPFQKTESYIDSENCTMTVYSFSEID